MITFSVDPVLLLLTISSKFSSSLCLCSSVHIMKRSTHQFIFRLFCQCNNIRLSERFYSISILNEEVLQINEGKENNISMEIMLKNQFQVRLFVQIQNVFCSSRLSSIVASSFVINAAFRRNEQEDDT